MIKTRLVIAVTTLILLAIIAGACAAETEDTDTLQDITWILESYGEEGNLHDVLEGTEITAIFDKNENLVHGSSGCNSYGGQYDINKNRITITEVYCTEMACLEPEGIMEQEQQYLGILPASETYEIKNGKLLITAGDRLLIFEDSEE